jgi:pyrroloquinoline quinone (PQQ) biosynthesis protein C
MSFYEQLIEATAPERADLFAAPAIAACLQGEVTLPTYLAFLQEAFHHVRHTTPILMSVGSRLPDRLAWLHKPVAEYIEEEIGHEEWILNDIDAAGGDTKTARASHPQLPAEVMVAYAYDLVQRSNPAGFFGMVFVLEGTSVTLALHAADLIQHALGLPDAAFSYLRSHGTLDQEHTRHLADLVDRMDPADQAEVLRCARVFYKLYGDIFRALPLMQLNPDSAAQKEPTWN